MENKLLAAIRRCGMVSPGDRVICAVSGGADSMALLWGMWSLREKLGVTVEAAHFNHHLRGAESYRDEDFVRKFCAFHDIPLHVGGQEVKPGEKGLEAAARDARYAFLKSLSGIIATAHTADDNAETVLMHLIRGTGLRGLGGITPKQPGLIRPMLDVTRAEVEAYLAENWIDHIDDSSNESDAFLRNRIRHHVMPLLYRENPSLNVNLSAMAQRLRLDEEVLENMSQTGLPPGVETLRRMEPALRRRALTRFLRQSGKAEPEAKHIDQTEALVLGDNPSGFVRFGGVVIRRSYDRLEAGEEPLALEERVLPIGGTAELPEAGMTVRCEAGAGEGIVVCPVGEITIRCRKPGDEITLPGGTKSLKKLFIDKKIPRHLRLTVPVAADERGVLAVYGFGANLSREKNGQVVTLYFTNTEKK